MGTGEVDLRAAVDKLVSDYTADMEAFGAFTAAVAALDTAQGNVNTAKAASDAAQKAVLDDLAALQDIAKKYADNDPAT